MTQDFQTAIAPGRISVQVSEQPDGSRRYVLQVPQASITVAQACLITLASDAQVGLVWYTREDWARLREIADDRDALDDSFEDWERNALAAIGELESAGRTVRKAPIDIDALVAWCGERRRALDSAARAEYVSELLQGEARLSSRPIGRG